MAFSAVYFTLTVFIFLEYILSENNPFFSQQQTAFVSLIVFNLLVLECLSHNAGLTNTTMLMERVSKLHLACYCSLMVKELPRSRSTIRFSLALMQDYYINRMHVHRFSFLIVVLVYSACY